MIGLMAALALMGCLESHAAAPPTGAPIDNRASLEYFLTASNSFVAIQSDAVRVIVGGTSPYLFTKSATPTAPAPGQEVTFTLTATPQPGTPPNPFPVTVNGNPQLMLILRDPLPVGTRFARFETFSGSGVPLYHRAGDPEHSYATTPPVLATLDAIALGVAHPPANSLLQLRFSVTIDTNATASFQNIADLFYDDGVTPPPTRLSSNPVGITPHTPVPPPAVTYYADNTYSRPVTATSLGQPLYIQATAGACNLDSTVAETNVITITSTKTGDRESVPVVETGPNTGVFRPVNPVPTRSGTAASGDGVVETVKNDSLTAELNGCGGASTTATILIDPAGIVFDSRSNLPVAGATVTLFDVNAGVPAIVFQADGTTPAPSTVVTGPDGRYDFPLVPPGTYRLIVTPPPGYTGPSTLPPAQLPAGRLIQSGSFGGNFPINAQPGAVILDYPLDPVAGGGNGLFVQKTASRTTAEIGDFIDYTVRIKNVSGAALTPVTVTDLLPLSFVYQRGSARLEGAAFSDPVGGAGPQLAFKAGTIADGATVTLTYRVRVGPGAMQGTGVNQVQAWRRAPGLPAIVSNVATAQVQLQPGVFTDKGVVLGKVFVDLNTNRVQDAGEPGVPGIRLYLEDGTYAITDGEGKYNFYGLSPRTHVLKLDTYSLPAGAKLQVLSTRNAGDAGSRFVELRRGELHKADFALKPGPPALMKEIQKRRAEAGRAAGEVELGAKSELTRDGVPLARGDPKSLPASGVVGGGAKSQGSNVKSTARASAANATNASPVFPLTPALSPSEVEREKRPPGTAESGRSELDETRRGILPLPGGEGRGEGGPITNSPAPSGILSNVPPPAPNFTPILPEGTLNAANSDLPGQRLIAPRVKPELLLTNLDNSPGFVELKDGDTLAAPQATVWVKGQTGAKFSLKLNGVEVPASRVGKRAVLAARKLEAWEFIGLSFRPGTNTLTLAQRDAGGNQRGAQTIRVLAPDKLGEIKILLPKTDQPADGKTPAKIVVLLQDTKGVPVTARTPLTLEASLGEWDVADLNKTEPGTQVFIEGGRAEFPLKPPIEPGDARVAVSSGAMQAEAVLPFLPDLRPLIAAGLLEGRLSLSSLKAGSIVPTRSRDGFEEELRSFAVSGNGGKQSAAARAAFFLKGKIKGEYLLTAGYDSDKDTKERLFRDIQPDEFYPVYGDSSVKGFDAQSTGRLYVRIDRRKSYLLFGDLVTQGAGEARSLGNYSRSLTGVREHYEKKNVSANLWASQDSTRQVIEEMPGNGTSGPYFFRNGDGLVNSEKVEMLTRDRNQPALILKAVPLSRFTDYEFEPFTGRILFRAPVPSLDANLNPISIRVTYEVEQGGEKFWVYGADAQVKANERVEVGGAVVRDENPQGEYGLYSGNATVKLGPKTFAVGEFAHSDSAGAQGNVGRVELRHQGEKTDARIYYGRAENTFSNAASILGGGRVEAGAKVSRKIGQNTRAVAQAIDTEATGGAAGSRKGVSAGVEHTFKNQVSVEVGGRYSTETANPAGPSTATPGVTPNEVKSVRAKITTPVPKVKNARLYGEIENDVVETGKRLVAVGGEYQVQAKTRLYARHEFIDALGGPFELNNQQQNNTTVVGLDTAYMKDGQLFNEYRMRNAVSGREAEAATGLRNLWNVAEGVRLSSGLERTTPVAGGNQNEATALTGGLEYTRNPDWRGTARLELRTATANDSLLSTFGYARKLSDDWTLLGRTIVYLVEAKGPSGGTKTQARFQGGLAYRQTEASRWNALGKYEYKIEDDSTQPGVNLQRDVHILSLHANYQPSAAWELSGHYAGKLALENSGGRSDVYHTHLLASHLTYELTSSWDIGLNVSALFSGDLRSIRYGLGPEIGFTVRRNLRLGVGYNVFGFTDRDLGAEDYTQRGVYLALRFKFDEAALGLGRKEGK